MTPQEIPQRIIDILDRHAGKKHGRNGRVVAAAAEMLTEYERLYVTHRESSWAKTSCACGALWPCPVLEMLEMD